MTRFTPVVVALALALLALLALTVPAVAAAWDEGDTIRTIRVEGNERVEVAAILDIMRLREGDLFRRTAVADAIRDVYRLRYFDDIIIEVEDLPNGVGLIVRVKEKPAIRDIRIQGEKKVTIEDIKEVMNLKPYAILDLAKVRANATKIEELYLDKGFFLAEVETRIVRGPANEVYVHFDIAEGRKVLVKKIDIVGNDKIEDRLIKQNIETREAGIFPGAGEAGTYRRETLELDVERIAFLYSSKGYIDADVSRPQVALSPDKRWVYVTIHVEEGPQYTIGDISLSGDVIGEGPVEDREAELLKLVKSESGEVFNRLTLAQDVERLVARYSEDGYAFANVIPLPKQDREKLTVDVRFDIQKGKVIYLEDIIITNNLATWDKTIRREIGLAEGDRWSGKEIERARARLQRLGYFEEVNITTPRGDAPNTLDMAIDVVEKPTGTFSLGAGFSTVESLVITANISRANFLGLGYTMAFNANISLGRNLIKNGFFRGDNSQQRLEFQLYDPYFLDTRWTASISLYLRNQTVLLTQFRRGLDIGFGRYLDPNNDLQVSLLYSLETVGLSSLRPSQKLAYGGNLYRPGTKSSLTASIIYDKRDNRISPTKGVFATAAAELAGGWKKRGEEQIISILGGDFRFLRLRANVRFFWPLGTPATLPPAAQVVFRYNFSFGWIKSLDGTVVPYTERYQAGGPYSLRGYVPLSLGPRIRSLVNSDPVHATDALPVGGTASIINNFEIEFPIVPPAELRGVVFFDAGNAFGGLYGNEPMRLENLRLSAGFGVRWRSPMGPLRFEWGFPIGRKPGERGQVFEFSVGSFF
jgi:outer membrane protein insertion porin family